MCEIIVRMFYILPNRSYG